MSDLPSPPFVEVAGVPNFRDIGGQDTNDNHRVKQGLVFRAADIGKVTDEGLKTMSTKLGIKVVFDLRSAPEIKRDGPEWEGMEVNDFERFTKYGVRREWVPVFPEKDYVRFMADYGPEQVALRYKEYMRTGNTGFVKAYHDISVAAPNAYGAIFRHLAKTDPQPFLVYCSAGKDRTGIVIAMLCQLVGVPAQAIAEEYTLTNLGLAHLRPLMTERLMRHPALEGNQRGVENMISCREDSMLGTLDMIQKDFGGSEGYMKQYCGLSDEDVAKIKDNLVSKDR